MTLEIGDKEISLFLERCEGGNKYKFIAMLKGYVSYPEEMMGIYEAALSLAMLAVDRMRESEELEQQLT